MGMINLGRRILYIDPLIQVGHVNFNNIYIRALIEAGFKIDFIFAKGYGEKLDLGFGNVIYSIPHFLLKNIYGGLGNRLAYFFVLILIRLKVNFKRYELVVFSSFEEISFYFSGISNCYLINHINVSEGYESSLKFYFLHRVLIKNTLIVLDRETEQLLKSKNNYKIIFQPHGLAKAKSEQIIEKTTSELVLKIKRFDKIIFSPSDSSSDKEFLKTLLDDSEFLNFLISENILFVYKGNLINKYNNVLQLNFFLDTSTYDYLFLKSNIILIAYPKNFRYRVSGVLLESITNNKPCLMSDIESIRAFAEYFTYNPFYTDINTLIYKIKNLLTEVNTKKFYKNLDSLEPNFRDCFPIKS
jgi:hypothetical protein